MNVQNEITFVLNGTTYYFYFLDSEFLRLMNLFMESLELRSHFSNQYSFKGFYFDLAKGNTSLLSEIFEWMLSNKF